MLIGVLTGGGDAPGLNAAIRAVTRKALAEGIQVVGFRDGWLGVLNKDFTPLDLPAVSGILYRGGTILGTSRTNPYSREGGAEEVRKNLKELGVDALIPIGGEDTLGVAARLSEEGVNLVGITKTIDNDLYGTDYSIGFDTAVSVVMDSLDKLHPTAESHNRVMVVEVMGRHAGWVATVGGLAGGADAVLVPEEPFSVVDLCNRLRKRHEVFGKLFSIVVVAEGAHPAEEGDAETSGDQVDEFGHARLGGVGHTLASQIEANTGYETRVVVLGHLQRGGSPSAFDRVLAIRLGVAAVEHVIAGHFGVLVGLRGNEIVPTSLVESAGKTHQLDRNIYKLADLFY